MRLLLAFLLIVPCARAADGPRREGPSGLVETVQHLGAPSIAQPIRPMRVARANHGALLLDDGRVYVIGGQGGYGRQVWDSSEYYDPERNAWSDGPNMITPRYNFVLEKLKDGRWLAAVGRGQGNSEVRAAELFDPREKVWTPTGPLREGRSSADSVALPDGRVLVAGGFQKDHTLSSIELYDPKTGKWSMGPSMRVPRHGEFLALLQDGRVLAAGGASATGDGTDSAELFDPKAGTWTPAAPLPQEFGNHRLFTLKDGRVLVAGGTHRDGGFTTASALYDPKKDRWTEAGGVAFPLHHSRADWIEGHPAILGGYLKSGSQRASQAFDESAGVWYRLPDFRAPRLYSSFTHLHDGRILVAGGENGPDATTSCEMLKFDGTPELPGPLASDEAPAEAAPPPQSAPLPFVFKTRPARPHDYAVVVGVERYKSLPEASFAAADARDFSTALMSLGVPEENIVRLDDTKAGLSNLSKYVEEWLPRRVSKDSRVFVFFSGHGAPDVATGVPYLMPWDGDSAFVKSTGFPLSRLLDGLEQLPASDVIVALDSCFSGSGGRSVLAPGLRPLVNVKLPEGARRRVSVLAASEAAEAAGPLPERRHGAFSYRLVEGLSGAADLDADGHLTLEELHAFTRKRVILDARAQDREQTPTLSTRTPKLRLY